MATVSDKQLCLLELIRQRQPSMRQVELAAIIGISQPQLSNICRGRFRALTPSVYRGIKNTLRVSGPTLDAALRCTRRRYPHAS